MKNTGRPADRGLLRNRNEPGRFFGDGVSFKAKLIGILEVGEARGDRMCQEALQDLKMAIRAAGEHKQRITIHVTIDGLRLRDEKTGDSLYHHPVHKISFIAQDMTDSRAFGYIFGSPDSGHRFFGIKTDKAASQVVLAMRDLFQVVFELKKKEIELARQHIQSKITAHEHQAASSATLMSAKTSSAMDGSGSYGKNHSSDPLGVLAGASGSGSGGASSLSRDTGAGSSKGMSGMGTLGKSEKSPESVADLVDLEQELSCIQRGITQMERITPSEGPGKSVIDDDPFGDSFANIPPAYNLLPPPESSKRHQKQANNRSTENLPKASETSPVVVSSSPPPVAAPPVPSSAASYESAASSTPGGVSSSAQAASASAVAAAAATTTVPNVSSNNSNSNSQPTSRHTPLLSTSQSSAQNDDWLNSPPNTSRFDPDPVRYSDEPKLAEDSPKVQPTGSAAQPSSYTDVFTDLDPLGTGKIKPYIDKKYFFQELKNPPKKVLKDLSGKDTATFNANFANEDHPLGGGGGGPASMLNASNISTLASGSGELFKANFEEAQAKMHAAEPPPVAASDDGGVLSSSSKQQQQHSTTLESSLGAGSASKNVDLFQEDEDFSKLQLDPFEVHFSRNASPRPPGPSQRGAEHRSSDGGDENVGEGGLTGGNRGEEEPSDTIGKAGVYNGPLQVNLPPESWASYISQKRLERQTSEANAQQMSGIGGGVGTGGSMARNRPAASSVFKQNTVDVISSLSSSSKKMKPNLFGQKFSKRDSNSINMRRLQESDSLSETETAPEPPPRPDSASHIEPPPLPPKKQFADIVIRPSPRSSSHSAGGGGNSNSFGDRGSAGGQRYDYVGSKYDSSTNRSSPQATGGGPASDAPPLPLPSRKVGRTTSAAADTIGPGRPPHRKSNEEEDYLTPIAGKPDIPTLLPPPQRKDGSKTSRSNTRKQSETDPRNLDEPTPPPTSKSPLASVFSKEQAHHSHSKQHQSLGPGVGSSSFLPDITLSQLLTLGIDELAAKLGVPVSKLSTMTLVELTSYLSEFIENSKQPSTGPMDAGYPPGDAGAGGRDGSVSESPVFKVNFDDSNEFVAKFDDNFGEDDDQQQQHRAAAQRSSGPSFVANFDELNMQSSTASRGGFAASFQSQPSAPSAPSTSVIDKYAVFREIMDQDTGGETGAGSAGGGDSDREQEQQTGASGAHGRLDLQAEVTTEMNRLSPAFAGEGLSPSATGAGGGTAFGLLASTGSSAPLPMTKIDTKITEVISQAKDRYAALRDIILVEDLFEKPAPMARAESSSFEERDVELDDAKFEANFDDMIEVVGGGTGDSPGINISDVSEPSNVELDDVTMPVIEGSGMALSGSFARISNATPREDLEIDELMQQAVSNLSLHTNDQHQLSSQQGTNSQSQSLTVKGSPMQVAHSSTSPYRPPTSTSTTLLNDMIGPQGSGGRSPAYTPEGMNLGPPGKAGGGGGTVIDTSTSPIPLGPKQGGMAAARSPILKPSSGDLQKIGSGGGGGGMKKKPTPAPRGTGGQSSSEKRSSGSVSDGDDETSPEGDNIEAGKRSRNTPTNSNESWAVFDQPESPLPPHSSKRQELRHESRHDTARRGDKNGPDSPCSSDPKDEWTKAADLREYGRRWPSKGGHTSSSSRDVSPWDEEGPDFRKRHQLHGSQSSQPPLPPSHHHQQQQHHHHHHPTSGERYHHPRMPPRRINSNDEDYEDELMKEQQQRGMRRRGMKGGVGSRSRDNFDDEHWYHDHHHATTWSSPTEDDESRAHAGSRSFDRNAYERSTYGPPYEKREPKSLPPYDRRDYKSYADGGKRKYYREREQSRGRSSYDYDPYAGGDGGYGGRGRVDYEDTYGCRGDAREAREYFYDRERKSFDRESNESYDSRERRSGFGSGDLYGSLDSRAEYREQRDRDRDRYLSLDKGRSLRRGMRNAGSARLDQDLDQDSEGDLMGGGMMGGRSSSGGGGLRGPDGGVNSLHRSSQNIGRMGGGKHGHGGPQQQQQQMLMDDDVWGVAAKGAGGPWKRPSSATEQDRRYDGGGGRRSGPSVGVGSSNPIGSDGEKDRRFRKKSRSRTSVGDRKDLELRSSNYATMRYPLRPKEDYFDFDAVEAGGGGGAGHGSGRRNSAGMAALDDDDDDDEEDEEEEEDDGGGGGRPSGASRTTGGAGMLMDDSLDDSPAYYGRRQAPPQSSSSSGYYGKSSSSLASRHAEQAGGRGGGLMNPAEALIAQEAKKMSRYEYEEEAQRRQMKKSNSRDLYFEGPERGYGGSVTPPKGTAPSSGGSKHHQTPTGGGRMEFEFDEFGDALAAPSGGGGKFSSGNYDPPGDGFESDFNSPPTMGAATTGSSSSMVTGGGQPKSYRFSNDFSIEKDRGGHYGGQEHPSGQGHYHRHAPSHHQYKSGGTAAGYGSDSVGTEYSHQSTTTPPPPPTSAPSSGSKLRFNENVTVSKFDAEATTMFEDDFAGRGSDVEQDLGGESQQQQQHQGGWPSSHSTSPGPAAAAAALRASPAGTGASGPTSNNGSNKKILKTSSQPSYHHTQHSQQYHHQQQQQQQHQKQYHQDNIRKSDSINIFAKKVDDPFEDDDFFSSQGAERDPFGGGGAGSHDPPGAPLDKAQTSSAGGVGGAATGTGWDKNFANFDDNI